eukprot:2571782-Rhodomonas_salina.1
MAVWSHPARVGGERPGVLSQHCLSVSGCGSPRALLLAGVHHSHEVKIERDFRSLLAGMPWGLG